MSKMSLNAEETCEVSNLSMETPFEDRFLHLSSQIDYDCEFIVGQEVIKGHKLIFAAASDVFRAMFYGEMKEDHTVTIEDLEPGGFNCMKHFIYTGKVNFKSVIGARSTYVAANKYLIPELQRHCEGYIKIHLIMHPSELIGCFEHYNKMNIYDELKRFCIGMIRYRFDEIVKDESFLEAETLTMDIIVRSQDIRVDSEIELFKHFERWALEEAKRRKLSREEIASSFNNLKKHIRFLAMSKDDIVTIVADSLLLTHEEKLAIALNKLKPNKKPMPESISQEEINRLFVHSTFLDGLGIYSQVLTISIYKSSVSYPQIIGIMYIKEHGLQIIVREFKKSIYFDVHPIKTLNFALKLLILLEKNVSVLPLDQLMGKNNFQLMTINSTSKKVCYVVLAIIPSNT